MQTKKLNLNSYYVRHSDVSRVLFSIKKSSKDKCYDLLKGTVGVSGLGAYIRTALDLSFDGLFKHQLNEMMGELNWYYFINRNTEVSIGEINELEKALINSYKNKSSVQGLLESVMNTACREVFIETLSKYASLMHIAD